MYEFTFNLQRFAVVNDTDDIIIAGTAGNDIANGDEVINPDIYPFGGAQSQTATRTFQSAAQRATTQSQTAART